jgi:xanthine/CO dehydrogenase XdhC/CoxF family maturation factor
LPCGGTIQLVVEPLNRDSGIRALLREIEAGHLVGRRLDLQTGEATLHPAQAVDGLSFDGTTLTTIHGPRYRMLVIGASQLSKYWRRLPWALAIRSRSATQGTSTPKRGTSRASRWCARCRTTRCGRCASTNAARSSR